MKRVNGSKKITNYIAKHPHAKPKQVALATGTNVKLVYNVASRLRKVTKVHEKEVDHVASIVNAVTQGAVRRRIQGWNPDDNPNYLVRQVDVVNHPAHYKVGGIEVIDFIESKNFSYNLGNVIKYVSRADHKGNKLEDLKKAQWYLTREINNLSK
jgi:hypothetical protein